MMIDIDAAAFERHALRYAERWGSDPCARLMRSEVHRTIEKRVPRGSSVLDLGCGTGIDSAWMIDRGYRVLAVDRSANMLAEARARTPSLEVMQCAAEEALERLGDRLFDAAILDFGVINCLDLRRLSEGLSQRIRPGGVVVIVPMPRVAPAWMLGALKNGRWRPALDRMRAVTGVDMEGLEIETRYLSASEIVKALGPGMRLRNQRSLGLTLPPPGSRSSESIGPRHRSAERVLASLPVLRRMGDHLLLVFERVPSVRPPRTKIRKIERRFQTARARRTGKVSNLRTLILELTNGCQSRCVGCSHRGPAGGEALDSNRIRKLLREAESLGADEVLLTGGEPLLRGDILPIFSDVRASSLRVTLLTNGLAVSRYAPDIVRSCDEVVVSMDAPDAATYRRLRGVDGFDAVEKGIGALRKCDPDFPIRGRCTVMPENASSLQRIASYGRSIGLTGLSFLAADSRTSDAFGRDGAVDLDSPDPELLEKELEAVWRTPGPPFVTNSRWSLSRILAKARSDRGGPALSAPHCDAPWTSVVVRSDLSLRPCFFLPGEGRADRGLMEGLKRDEEWRRRFVQKNESACMDCVCWARLGV